MLSVPRPAPATGTAAVPVAGTVRGDRGRPCDVYGRDRLAGGGQRSGCM